MDENENISPYEWLHALDTLQDLLLAIAAKDDPQKALLGKTNQMELPEFHTPKMYIEKMINHCRNLL